MELTRRGARRSRRQGGGRLPSRARAGQLAGEADWLRTLLAGAGAADASAMTLAVAASALCWAADRGRMQQATRESANHRLIDIRADLKRIEKTEWRLRHPDRPHASPEWG